MILKLILNVLGFIASTFINFITSILPDYGLGKALSDALTFMINFCQQSYNFMYLIFGETLLFVVPICTGLLLLKYTIIPIVIFLRSIVVNSNN